MDFKRLIVRGISYSQTQTGAYALLLEEEGTSIKLPVVIGSFEAQSISLGLEKDLKSPRPLTHDLFATFVEEAHFTMISMEIYKMVDGVFFSNINFINKLNGEKMTLDARTSDAVAMAVRFNVPIYTTQQIIDEAGILLELDTDTDEVEEGDNLSKLTIEELKMLLDEAVQAEDFDTAVELQEEIKKRNKKID